MSSQNQNPVPVPKASCYFMLLGETGSGKSTLLNYFVNYFRNGSIDDVKKIKVAIPTKYLTATEKERSSEHDLHNSTSSKTDACTPYLFNHPSGDVCVIDTPGLSDTRGAEYDDKNIDQILKMAETLPGLNALVLVINGSNARMTLTLTNVINRLTNFLPDSLLSNILVVFTNCLEHTRNFDLKSLTFTPFDMFHMQNSAFSTDPKRWTQQAKKSIKFEWETSMDTIVHLMKTVRNMSSQTCNDFTNLRDMRNNLKSKIASCLSDFANLSNLQDQLEDFKLKLKGAECDIKKYRKFLQQQTIEEISIVEAPYHSTLCSACRHVCHDNCGLELITVQGSKEFSKCACMGHEGVCKVCPNHCPPSSHYHDKKTIKKQVKTIENILADVKGKHDAAIQGQQQYSDQINNFQQDMSNINQMQLQKLKDIKDTCRGIKRICTNFNIHDELGLVIAGLEMTLRNLKSQQARDDAKAAINNIQKFLDQLEQTVPKKKHTHDVVDHSRHKRVSHEKSSNLRSHNDDENESDEDREVVEEQPKKVKPSKKSTKHHQQGSDEENETNHDSKKYHNIDHGTKDKKNIKSQSRRHPKPNYDSEYYEPDTEDYNRKANISRDRQHRNRGQMHRHENDGNNQLNQSMKALVLNDGSKINGSKMQHHNDYNHRNQHNLDNRHNRHDRRNSHRNHHNQNANNDDNNDNNNNGRRNNYNYQHYNEGNDDNNNNGRRNNYNYNEGTHGPNQGMRRCPYWPKCPNNGNCIYVHPKVLCNQLPDCRFDSRTCFYIHPNCLNMNNCRDRFCKYDHPTTTTPKSKRE